MSEIIDNSSRRKKLLKELILQLHKGEAPEEVKTRLQKLLGSVSYNEVVEVEQELIREGLPEEEIMKLCDLHTRVLDGSLDKSGAKPVPEGHPVDVFKKENKALVQVVEKIHQLYEKVKGTDDAKVMEVNRIKLIAQFNQLMDVDKHYQRKENLLFPFLEKYGITGPPKVMWSKHDEIRSLLKAALETLNQPELIQKDPKSVIGTILQPASESILEMIMKEEEILFPMCMDKLSEENWYEVHIQTPEIGYCIVEPETEWKPESVTKSEQEEIKKDGRVRLPTGTLERSELMAILNTLPVDITFVDKHDKVKYFSVGKERIFTRTKAILKRDVRLCHPPSSVHVVEKILQDFKEGKQNHAPFWIQMKGKFIHIEYFAIRDEDGQYIGTLEVSQDLTEKRALQGEQRLLNYN